MRITLQSAIRSLAGIGLVALLVLASCSTREERPVLPEGEQTVEGILEPVELSLVRRGTHLLTQNGDGVFYVESSAVSLREFEGMKVSVRGLLSENADTSFLPVLTAIEGFDAQLFSYFVANQE